MTLAVEDIYGDDARGVDNDHHDVYSDLGDHDDLSNIFSTARVCLQRMSVIERRSSIRLKFLHQSLFLAFGHLVFVVCILFDIVLTTGGK